MRERPCVTVEDTASTTSLNLVGDVLPSQLVCDGIGHLLGELAPLFDRLLGGLAEILLLGLGQRQGGAQCRAERDAERGDQDRLLLRELLELAAALLNSSLRLLQRLLVLLLALGQQTLGLLPALVA